MIKKHCLTDRIKKLFTVGLLVLLVAGCCNPLYALPLLKLDQAKGTLSISTGENNRDMQECVKNGLELSCRYSFKPCEGKRLWFDNCRKEKIAVRSIKYVPIDGSYKVAADFLQDKEPPVVMQMDSYDLAVKKVIVLENMNLVFLVKEGASFFDNYKSYLNSRIVCSCKEDYNKAIAEVASALTLGIVELNPYDSGTLKYRP